MRHGIHGAVKLLVFALHAAGGHPVGGEFDVADIADINRRDIGNGFADTHSTRCGRVKQGERGFFAHAHGFATVRVEAHQRHGAVGHGGLPRAHHLVAVRHAAHSTVADGNQEVFRGHGGQAQYAVRTFLQIVLGGGKRLCMLLLRFVRARGFGRFAQQYVQRQIHGAVVEQFVAHLQTAVVRGGADHGKRAAFALADGAEFFQIFGQDGQHITLLRFVAPDLQRRHAVFFQRHIAQFEHRAASRVVHQFREGVGQAARAHVVDGDNRVSLAELPAAVDDFLRAPFDFGIATLHGVEVQIRAVAARVHR